jgi:hypothetical protein
MSFWDGTQWVAEEHVSKSPSPRRARRSATLAMIVGLAALVVPFSTIDARSSAGTISLNQADPVHYMASSGGASTTGTTANIGFTISQTATTTPWVTVVCNGKQSYAVKSLILYGQTLGYFASWPYGQTFTVGVGSSNLWIEAATAKCSAELWYTDTSGSHVTLAKTAFTAEP